MKQIKGFVACDNGQPVKLELSEEIVGGTSISDGIVIFDELDDCEKAVMSNQARYGNKAVFDVHEVTLNIGAIVSTGTYDESQEEDDE